MKHPEMIVSSFDLGHVAGMLIFSSKNAESLGQTQFKEGYYLALTEEKRNALDQEIRP